MPSAARIPFPGQDPGINEGLRIENHTPVTVVLMTLVDSRWYDLRIRLSPGQVSGLSAARLADDVYAKNGCTIGVLAAFGPDGAEVARHRPPLCVGD